MFWRELVFCTAPNQRNKHIWTVPYPTTNELFFAKTVKAFQRLPRRRKFLKNVKGPALRAFDICSSHSFSAKAEQARSPGIPWFSRWNITQKRWASQEGRWSKNVQERTANSEHTKQMESRAFRVYTAQNGGRKFWPIEVARVAEWCQPESSFWKGL